MLSVHTTADKPLALLANYSLHYVGDVPGGLLVKPDFEKAKALLKEAGYDGTPIVLMQSTTLPVLTNMAPVTKALLEQGGFKVDMQAMDWQTVLSRRARKEPLDKGGWSGFMTAWVSADLLDPIVSSFVAGSCDKAAIGWPCDEKLEKLRDEFARTTDPARRKELAEAVQVRVSEYPTHAHLGQYNIPVARRKNVTGNLEAPAPVFWNVKKQ